MTIFWSASMSAMGKMPMPGGWTMAMAWKSWLHCPGDHGKPSSVIAPTRKNHALGEAARLLRVRKLLN